MASLTIERTDAIGGLAMSVWMLSQTDMPNMLFECGTPHLREEAQGVYPGH